jgi:hypothetical protein
MSFPPPYRSGHREFKTLAGLERAVERFEGKVLSLADGLLRVEWPAGVHEYPLCTHPDHTEVELQLQYDLRP